MPARRSSAVPLAWLYAALVVYASLYPFSGWGPAANAPLAWLTQLWTPWWTAFDIVSNLLGYLPLGALVFAAWVRGGSGPRTAFGAGLLLPALLSFAMETAQNLLPARVPSALDLAMNTLGAAAGAGLGLLAHAAGGLGHWQAWRARWFAEPAAGGIALLAAWPVALLFPAPLPLGLGQLIGEVREAAAGWVEGTAAEEWVQEWLAPSTSWVALSPATEVVAVALGALAPVAVAAAAARGGWRRAVLIALTLVCGAATTTLSTALNFGPQHALAWASPTSAAGFALAGMLALPFAVVPARVAAALGLVVLSALVAIVAQAPADPYFAQSLQAWEQGKFIRFHGAAQWVGWFWPYVAIGYLLLRTTGRTSN